MLKADERRIACDAIPHPVLTPIEPGEQITQNNAS
jgi:hypothetical protein